MFNISTIYDTITIENLVINYDTILVNDTILKTVIDSSGNISKIQKAENILVNLFPNPAYKIINIKSPIIIQSIDIHTLEGKVYKLLNVNSEEISFNFENAIPGQYILKIKTEKGIITKKLILKEQKT